MTGTNSADNLIGTTGPEQIYGLAGNDTISPLTGEDYVDGGDDNDLLILDYSSISTGAIAFSYHVGGSGGASVPGELFAMTFEHIERLHVTATSANDTFGFGQAALVGTVDGGAGTDDLISMLDFSNYSGDGIFDNRSGHIEYAGATILNIESFREAGGDFGVKLGSGNDRVYLPSLQRDSMFTGGGNDTLYAGYGNDYLNMGAGDDQLVMNFLDHTDFGLSFGYNTAGSGSAGYVSNTTFDGVERLSVVGTNLDDSFGFQGATLRGMIDGKGGVDFVSNLNFSSTSAGGVFDNSEKLVTYAGATIKNMESFPGSDLGGLVLGSGDDLLILPSTERDVVNTGSGADTLKAGYGNDYLDGGAGTDLLVFVAPAGSSQLSFGYRTDRSGSIGYAANTTFDRIERLDITGTPNADAFAFQGSSFKGTINGKDGIDQASDLNFSGVDAGGTFDNSTNLVTYAGATVKNIESFTGSDLGGLVLGDGNDQLILPSAERDVVNTGGGADTLQAGYGNDYLNGGAGTDFLIFDAPTGSSKLTFTYRADHSGGIGYAANTTFDSIERIQIAGTPNDDALSFENAAFKGSIDGKGGIDQVSNLNFSAVNGGGVFDNSERLVEYAGATIRNIESFFGVTLGNGDDKAILPRPEADVINAGGGNDTVTAGNGNDYIDGGAGSDFLILDFSNQAGPISFVHNADGSGASGNTTFVGIERVRVIATNNDDRVTGGSGDDVLEGLGGNDSLIGGTGKDTLTGARSQSLGRGEIDTLTGGGSNDLFLLGDRTGCYYDNGKTSAGVTDYALITDFTGGVDRLQLEGSAAQYRLGNSPLSSVPGKAVFLETGATDELVAILQRAGSNTLSDSNTIDNARFV